MPKEVLRNRRSSMRKPQPRVRAGTRRREMRDSVTPAFIRACTKFLPGVSANDRRGCGPVEPVTYLMNFERMGRSAPTARAGSTRRCLAGSRRYASGPSGSPASRTAAPIVRRPITVTLKLGITSRAGENGLRTAHFVDCANGTRRARPMTAGSNDAPLGAGPPRIASNSKRAFGPAGRGILRVLGRRRHAPGVPGMPGRRHL